MKRTILLLCLFVFKCAQAQEKPQLSYRTTTPTPPDITSLGRYTMQPPNLSNGRPQQTINLLDINENGVSFSLNLYYDYSGFRLKEETTRMGLGWGLTEGSIIKIVKHVDDDHPGLLKRFSDFGNNLTEEYGPGVTMDSRWAMPRDFGDFDLTRNRLYYKLYDGQPDLYIYNFNGYDGKFLLIGEDVVNLEHNDLKIDRGFQITTPDGLIYIFELTDGTFVNSNVQARTCNNTYVTTFQTTATTNTAWKLSRIYNPNTGGYINFTYHKYRKDVQKYGDEPHSLTIIGHKDINHPSFTYDAWHEDETQFATTYYTSVLQTIETESMLVSVISDKNADRISEIQTYHKSDLKNPLQTILFDHEYFGNQAKEEERWLKLKGIKIEGGQKEAQYKFSYNDEQYTSGLLNKRGKSIDHWGFFNGKNNATLYPAEIKEQVTAYIPSFNHSVIKWANREPDITYSKKFALEKIEFPTKGYAAYEYELCNGYGIRVKHIEENDGKQSSHRYYDYGAPYNYKPFYFHTGYYVNYWCPVQSGQYMHYITFPVYSMNTLDYCNDVIVCSGVTELFGDKNGSGGKIAYQYTLHGYPSTKPLLTEKKYYDANSLNIKSEQFYYERDYLGQIPYWEIPELTAIGSVIPNSVCETNMGGAASCQPYDDLDNYPYILGGFQGGTNTLPIYWTSYAGKTSTEDGVASTIRFRSRELPMAETPPVDCNIIETTETKSDGKIHKTQYAYAADFKDDPICAAMIRQNMLGLVVQQRTYEDQTFLQSSKLTFKLWNDKHIAPCLLTTTSVGMEWNERTYAAYDQYANPSCVVDNEGIPVSYLWGYSGQYPIAKIENASLSEVKAALGIDINTIASKLVPSDSDFAKINGLRQALPKAMITTYTYKPFVGMSSETDPSERTINYQYDKFGRLEFIKNGDKHIMKHYQYN